MEKGFFVYAWDLAEEGPKSVLAKIQELGANTVCLASSYHAGKFTRPRAKQKIYFPVDGTVYFEPNRQLYRSIQAKRNPVLAQTTPLLPKSQLLAWKCLLHLKL